MRVCHIQSQLYILVFNGSLSAHRLSIEDGYWSDFSLLLNQCLTVEPESWSLK